MNGYKTLIEGYVLNPLNSGMDIGGYLTFFYMLRMFLF